MLPDKFACNTARIYSRCTRNLFLSPRLWSWSSSVGFCPSLCNLRRGHQQVHIPRVSERLLVKIKVNKYLDTTHPLRFQIILRKRFPGQTPPPRPLWVALAHRSLGVPRTMSRPQNRFWMKSSTCPDIWSNSGRGLMRFFWPISWHVQTSLRPWATTWKQNRYGAWRFLKLVDTVLGGRNAFC